MKLSAISQIDEDIASDDLSRAFDQLQLLFNKLEEVELEDQVKFQKGRLTAYLDKVNSNQIDFDHPAINQIRMAGLDLNRKLSKLLERKNIQTEEQLKRFLSPDHDQIANQLKQQNEGSPPVFSVNIGNVNGGAVNSAHIINQTFESNLKKKG